MSGIVMNIQVNGFWWTHIYISVGNIAMGRVAGLEGRHVLNFSRYCQTDFQSGCAIWPSRQQYMSIQPPYILASIQYFPQDKFLTTRWENKAWLWAEANRDLRYSLQAAERSLPLKRATRTMGAQVWPPEAQFYSSTPSHIKSSAVGTNTVFSIAKEVTLFLLKQGNK